MSTVSRVPTSSYAQMQARRNYYARNREAIKLMNKMYRAGVRLSTSACRAMVAKEAEGAVRRGEP